MTGFDSALALRCIDEPPMSKESDRVARYWLSLWHGDRLPCRSDFKPRAVADLLPNIAIFDVVPDKSVFCRLAGSVFRQSLDVELTGKDWLALTPEQDRLTRLARWSAVARGAIGRGLRSGFRESGEVQQTEEVMLPFGDISEDGQVSVLFHIAWQQSLKNPTRVGLVNTGGLAVDFRLCPLRRE